MKIETYIVAGNEKSLVETKECSTTIEALDYINTTAKKDSNEDTIFEWEFAGGDETCFQINCFRYVKFNDDYIDEYDYSFYIIENEKQL